MRYSVAVPAGVAAKSAVPGSARMDSVTGANRFRRVNFSDFDRRMPADHAVSSPAKPQPVAVPRGPSAPEKRGRHRAGESSRDEPLLGGACFGFGIGLVLREIVLMLERYLVAVRGQLIAFIEALAIVGIVIPEYPS